MSSAGKMLQFLSKLRLVSRQPFTVPVCTGGLTKQTNLKALCYNICQCFSINTVNGQRFLDHGFSRHFSTEAKENEYSEDTMPVIKDMNEILLNNPSSGRLFAVIHIAGKQRKITAGDIIVLDKPLEADIGEDIRINKVLLVGSSDFTFIGRPLLNNSLVKVEATILEKTLSHPIVCSWYKRREDWRRMYLHKRFYTYLRIRNIEIQTPPLHIETQT